MAVPRTPRRGDAEVTLPSAWKPESEERGGEDAQALITAMEAPPTQPTTMRLFSRLASLT